MLVLGVRVLMLGVSSSQLAFQSVGVRCESVNVSIPEC